MSAKPKDVRAARAFLRKRNLGTRDMSPRLFADAAEENGGKLEETLKLAATLMMGTQGRGPAPIAQKIAEKAKR